jgi:phosphoribosylamine--glycine ligase / phosphoribosylformylglycinamidine cyclo-ligase
MVKDALMDVLLIGSGGREHALAWKLAQSPRLGRLFTAPGNPGTSQLGENISLPDPPEEAARLACSLGLDLVVIGPEAPLAAGLADALREQGLLVFGPSHLAAEIESSKAFAKEFMERWGIPTARYAVFQDFDRALAYVRQSPGPVVIKASGLAAGKGVFLPESLAEAAAALRTLLVEQALGSAGRSVIIEERLQGEEVSLLAFCDGQRLQLMPPAQDHKRLLDGDRGPNTGGMGAYAPAPVCPPELAAELGRTILQPAVDGLAAEGRPFVGVLYAGLILTPDGPRVLEFNCRFGDPETQALLLLLESDLLEILTACAQGQLDAVQVRWKAGAAACVVMGAAGYPGAVQTGQPIRGLQEELPGTAVFQAGSVRQGQKIVTAGGRVLGVTGWGADLKQALERAYTRAGSITFEGCHYRRDIGWQAQAHLQNAASAYARAGVSIDAGSQAVSLMRDAVQSTYGHEVLAGIGSFGGLYDAQLLQSMQAPVLVASTDGVGTKVKLAAQARQFASIGEDIVNHCINDILVQGARPLFFLDYIAASQLEPQMVAEVVAGMASACRAAGCALLGGETAEMPGVYAPAAFDVAGTIVGVVERSRILPRSDIQAGDVLIGLASSGPHTNGYSLIRSIFEGADLNEIIPELGVPLAAALLAPHRSYLPRLAPLLAQPELGLKGMAHITGGGLVDNIPRILPPGLGAVVQCGAWPVPPLFRLIQERGQVTGAEMHRVFNMGLGMVLIAAPEQAAAIQACLPEQTWQIGRLEPGIQGVSLQ